MATINQPPRVQLGDAPLAGYPGSELDQIVLIWQTLGSHAGDSFTVEYRLAGTSTWTTASGRTTQDTGVGGRVMHEVEIAGLAYDATYEYRVTHTPAGGGPVLFQDTFDTRLAAGDSSSFSFAAYGDSADAGALAAFNAVQSQIAADSSLEFALLLGDNAYSNGTYDEFDMRFETGTAAPTTLDWIASHVDYAGYGNHDAGSGGAAYKHGYALPVPDAGIDAPINVPGGASNAELYYSFDYGDAHFVTFDSNVLNSPSALAAAVDYMVADLNASTAKWKVAFAHHPVGGSPDKGEGPEDNYWQEMVDRLHAAKLDLFLVGHSHTFHSSYPLTGNSGTSATFVLDTDFTYDKHAGIVQVTAGTGGTGLRPGSFAAFDYIAQGYTTTEGRVNGATTATRVEHGFAKVTAEADRLVVDYISAATGQKVAGSQTITIMAGGIFAGGPGAETLTGGTGWDTISGGGGDDLIQGMGGGDTIDGGAGSDTVSYAASSSGVAVNLATGRGSGGDATRDIFTSIENVIGSAHGDTLTGTAGGNTLEGGAGDDTLIGGPGADFLDGGAGTDTVDYSTSAARVVLFLGGGGLAGDADGDTIVDVENAIGSAFNDIIYGSGLANTLTGGAGRDVLVGFGGNDLLVGEAGDDILSGGSGSDTLEGGAGRDVFRVLSGDGTDTVADWGEVDDFFLFRGIAGVAARSDLTFTVTGADVEITAATDPSFRVIVLGVELTDLDQAANFIFQ